jgi:lysophospholipase L1-like esterase
MKNRISIFRKESCLILVLIILFAFCSPSPKGIIIVCAGDSITEFGYPRHLRNILKNKGLRARILNQGKSGHNSREYLSFLKKNLDGLRKSSPDFVLLQLGTNDVRIDHDYISANDFYNNMKQIITLLHTLKTRTSEKPRILLATIPPVTEDTPYPFAPESRKRVEDEINPLIQKIALEEKIPLVDNFSLFLESPHLLQDVHPSQEGYKVLAQNWFNALKKEGL